MNKMTWIVIFTIGVMAFLGISIHFYLFSNMHTKCPYASPTLEFRRFVCWSLTVFTSKKKKKFNGFLDETKVTTKYTIYTHHAQWNIEMAISFLITILIVITNWK